MCYIVLLANKRNTSDKHWKVFGTEKEAREYAGDWNYNDWLIQIYELGKSVY